MTIDGSGWTLVWQHSYILKIYPSQLRCTTSQISTKAVLLMVVDGVIYPTRNALVPTNK